MKIQVGREGNAYIYKVSDSSGVSESELKSMYYEPDENGIYRRIYPCGLMFEHDGQSLENNYNNYLMDKENEIHKNDRNAIDNAIEWICRVHENNNIKWWLAGSAALYVRGIDVWPHDIDIMTYKTEIAKLQKSIGNYISEPFHHVENWVVKGFGVVYRQYRIDYAFEPEEWVDGNGYVDFGPYAQSHLEKIKWNNYTISVPPLELHIKSNQARGRTEIVDKIKALV
ncbi:MAG TPA: hypothetical protein PKW98_00590 [Candidatus Wallbacteria bacterium]|nr:MAG: hypothetical protein BWY32_00736 [bacterium ADurb.Bin243]HOD40192.1 hypothetical protein [Candidatus Wallbacteria bacterium]HPG56285.1 hypothetical protein [Candidatus Wallbacteria bacterium]